MRGQVPRWDGASKGAWTLYTPALTGITLGNGVLDAGWARGPEGSVFRVRVFFGSSTGVTGAVTIGLPAQSVGGVPQIVNCMIGSVGGSVPLGGVGFIGAGATVVQPFHTESTTVTTLRQLGTVGLTLNANAYVLVEGIYEPAV